mgnify:CR=1 FL=1|tara:strand:- start:40039 stop:40743 length:705 start_codon:yes stop_codon:yes gene_type:complete
MGKDTGLTKIAENIWAVEGQASLMPGVKLPARATVVRLEDGGLMVHSPISFSEETAAAIGALGEVTTLLAPNLFHHLYLEKAQSQFPDARTFAGSGMASKRKGLRVDETFGAKLPGTLSHDFDHVMIEGAPKFDELVLCHRASRTLIVADYFFNIHDTKGLLSPLVLKMTGSYKRATQSKLWRKMAEDREAMARSARAVLDLDYQRVIMCHGEVVEDGREFTRASLDWLLAPTA